MIAGSTIKNERVTLFSIMWTAKANGALDRHSLTNEAAANVVAIGERLTGLFAALHLVEPISFHRLGA